MVCLGNICRSPLAEGILQQEINERGLPWEVDSAGTDGWHAGEAPDQRSQKVAMKFGIDISRQKARKLRIQDFEMFDEIWVMDNQNMKDVLALNPVIPVRLLGSFDSESNNVEIPDPYYDQQLFEPVFQQISKSVKAYLSKF